MTAAGLRSIQALQSSYDTLQDQMDSVKAQSSELQRELTRAGEELSRLKQELCDTREAREVAEAQVQVRPTLRGLSWFMC